MKLAIRIFGLEGNKTAGSIKRVRKFTLNSPGISSEKEENDGEVQETRNTNSGLLVKPIERPQRDTRGKILVFNH
jgi:hypothetical protein